jgi:hypothetical protein
MLERLHRVDVAVGGALLTLAGILVSSAPHIMPLLPPKPQAVGAALVTFIGALLACVGKSPLATTKEPVCPS